MSGEKATSPCNKFQANIFNKSKCQNCFKSRELHLLTDRDMEQAKPIYADWLCLAPVGTDFDNPMQRSRKWQRRFFILYEHGSLSFALDELRSTLPQGTVDLNLCTDIVDAEPRTGQRNALCIVTPEQEIFIRGDNKEIINGWSEQLGVFLRTNRQNQKKKRKVEPVASQEPSPAKMAATDPSFSSSQTAAESGCGRWQEDQQGRGPGGASMWTITDTDPPGPKRTPAGNTSPYLSPAAEEPPISGGSLVGPVGPVGSLDLVVGGNADAGGKNQPAESKSIQTSANNNSQSQNKSNGGSTEELPGTDVSRTGRSETRSSKREKLQSCGDISQLAAPPPQRRARSLDRRTSDTVMTPDLLNFKKGWLVKLDENEQWKKYWFVLSTDSLRFYKDSMAEEASDLEGEIDLTKCYNVSEYQVQRNYGFQIHTPKGVYALSAMTSGIRKNWIQALMKNVHPANAPDVASLPGHHGPCSPPEALPKPDVTQDSPPVDVSTDPHPKHRTVMERRREGRYRTFDWAELRPQKNKPALDPEPQRTKAPGSLELGDLERRKRREERRRRYESMLGISLGWGGAGDETADGDVRALSPKSQQKVAEEIEECWKLVEQTVFRLEKTGPLFPEAKDSAELEKLLDSYRTGVDDLKAQLAESERRRLELKAQLDSPLNPEPGFCPSDSNKKPLNGHTQTVTHSYREARELLQEQNIIRQGMQEQLSLDSPSLSPQAPRIWLHDAEGNFQELAETVATPLLSPASDSQDLFSDGETSTTKLQNELSRDDCQQVPASQMETNSEYGCLFTEKPAERDGKPPSCCVEQHVPPDQAMVRKLSQEVELLTSQNEALNQRNQEMVNQLTEADREIERLKAELSSRYTEPRHLPEVEQLGQTADVADLERELSLRNQELLEAQSLITSLEENLRETEALLNLSAADQEKSKIAEKADECLLRYLEGKLAELERQLGQSEASCRELQIQNAELKEAEKVYRQTAEASVARLSQELEKVKEGGLGRRVSGEERIQEVIEGTATRLSALGKLLEVMDKLDVGLRKKESENTMTSQLKWEEEFWSSLLNELNSEEPVEVLLSEATERMIVEKQMLLLGQELLSKTDEGREGLDIIWNTACETETKKTDDKPMFDRLCQIKQFRAVTQMKMSSLNLLASSVRSSAQDDLQLLAERLWHFSEHPRSGLIHSAATEALFCFHLSRLQSEYDRELEEAKQKLLASSLICSSCVDLMEENTRLRATLSKQDEESSSGNKLNMQTEEIHPQDTEVQEAAGVGEENVQETPEEEKVESSEPDCTDIPLSCAERDENTDQNDASCKESDLSLEMEEVLELRRKVEELEEQLTVMEEQMKEELSEKLRSAQTLHVKEMEKLKVTFDHGFTSMEESHLKVVEELQRRHQQEVERLLAERDHLLEEESAATATAIGAIKNAHRLELEREVQRRCQTGNTHLEDVYRQHSEELTSYQRELQVLSQQFSLKCLENGHLVQALDAERKALCQCQQENQDLRTRNQELSGHLAAEITRLCSLAKQDALPLSQAMDVYEMEITLRVKETEVQCLKQEITSLKDELQAAQKDKRNATKKYKDIYTELSILRAKTERELDELRENLRLAHRALDSP